MKSAYESLLEMQQARTLRSRTAQEALAVIVGRIQDQTILYGQLESEGDPGADKAQEALAAMEKEQTQARRKLTAIEANMGEVSPGMTELAQQIIEEINLEEQSIQTDKGKLVMKMEKAQDRMTALFAQFFDLQAKQLEHKKQLKQVFGTWPGGSDYRDLFNQQPRIHIERLNDLPLVDDHYLREKLGDIVFKVE